MRLLILGGTGTTGKAFIGHLRLDNPVAELVVVSRTAVDLPGATHVLTGHYADLTRTLQFRRELAAFDAVIHLGDGLSVLQQGHHAAGKINRLIAASEDITQAVREAQVRLFVYVSSIKAVADEVDDRVLVEASEPRPTTLYGRSKLRLERSVATILSGSATRLVILRNPVMYGEKKAGSLHRLIELADTPLPLPLGGVINKRSLLAVRNFASALVTVVRAGPESPSGVFHVHDGPPLSTSEIVGLLRTALGRPRRLFPIGQTVAGIVQRMPLLGPTARRLYGSLQLSDTHFRQNYHWTPNVDTKTGLAEMLKPRLGPAPSE